MAAGKCLSSACVCVCVESHFKAVEEGKKIRRKVVKCSLVM